MMGQIIDPQPKFFSTLAVIYFQIIIANFQKKIVGCRWNWIVLKADKISENIKKFHF